MPSDNHKSLTMPIIEKEFDKTAHPVPAEIIQIITDTLKVFTKGTANNSADLFAGFKKNLNIDDLMLSIRASTVDLETSNLDGIKDPTTKVVCEYIIQNIVKSHFYKLGLCDEITAVAMYLATQNSQLIESATIAGLSRADHAFLKVKIKDAIFFVDPWYKTSKHTGAIVSDNADDFYKYQMAILDVLNASKQTKKWNGPINQDPGIQHNLQLLAIFTLAIIANILNMTTIAICLSSVVFSDLIVSHTKPLLIYLTELVTLNKYHELMYDITNKSIDQTYNFEDEIIEVVEFSSQEPHNSKAKIIVDSNIFIKACKANMRPRINLTKEQISKQLQQISQLEAQDTVHAPLMLTSYQQQIKQRAPLTQEMPPLSPRHKHR